ncbi:MAG: Mycothiol acetyltransferase [Candidatus Thorarchaeota archaeon AB_25]|nr:MAG: Mycothiol acetyltransferase [Candidatus Thorarchaeota archaeon AB_25]
MKLKHEQHIRKIEDSDRDWLQRILSESWGSARIVTRGTIHQADSLSGFLAEVENQNVGVITWNVNESMLEIITLNVLRQREGIGRALVNAVIGEAESLKCSRVWVITTNDNNQAVQFYQALGFKVIAVHKGAVNESRKIKPEIPLIGIDGIPITDEIELEKILSG